MVDLLIRLNHWLLPLQREEARQSPQQEYDFHQALCNAQPPLVQRYLEVQASHRGGHWSSACRRCASSCPTVWSSRSLPLVPANQLRFHLSSVNSWRGA